MRPCGTLGHLRDLPLDPLAFLRTGSMFPRGSLMEGVRHHWIPSRDPCTSGDDSSRTKYTPGETAGTACRQGSSRSADYAESTIMKVVEASEIAAV